MVDKTLLAEIKRKLNITWEDSDTNQRVEEIIESAIPSLIKKLGITDHEFDFSEAGHEKTLLKNYCLYEWNHCVNEFDDNYSQDIAEVRRDWEVKYHLAESESENEEESV